MKKISKLYKKSMSENTFTVESNKKSFTLANGIEKNSVWIEKEDGEGGDFNLEDLFKVIEKFYNERF